MKPAENAQGKILVIGLTLIVGLGILYLTWYQMVGRSPLPFWSAAIRGLLLASLVVFGNWILCRWLLGWDAKPVGWKVMEAQGNHWHYTRKNMPLVPAFLSIPVAYALYSLLVDLLMGQPLTSMLQYSFHDRGVQILHVPILWDSKQRLLFLGFHLGFIASALSTFFLYKPATVKAESAHPTYSH
jgi:hypothetical protein